MNSRPKILIVDDDLPLMLSLEECLHSSYEIYRARSGRYALKLLAEHSYACILLDLYLGDMSGLEIVNFLRDNSYITPVLIMSGESSISQKVKLLDAGANDYIVKPFDVGELNARLRVLVRKINTSKTYKITCEDLVIDTQTKQVVRDGLSITLRSKEYEILECLAYNAGNIVHRNTLVDYAWEPGCDAWRTTVNVHIKTLRDKIDRPFTKQLITTARGYGYKLDAARTITPQ